MERYFRLFEALKKIYGSKFLSDLFGKKKTNLIKLPPKEAKDFLKKELNIAEAGDRAVAQGKKDLAELVLDIKQIEKLNDQELLTLTNNAERMAQRINPESFKPAPKGPADIIDMRTQETVPSEGIGSLIETSGQKTPPGTLMGNLESRIKQLETSGEDLSKMKGQTLDDIMKGEGQALQGMSQFQKEGLVKATANDIMIADVKSGKLEISEQMKQEILEGSPKSLDYFRRFYGEDALEVLDSLIPDLAKMRTSREAADFAKKQYNFEPKMDRAPGSIDLDDAKKAEDEFGITSLKNPSEAYKPFGSDLTPQEKIDWLIKNVDPEAEVTIPSPGALQNMLDSGREDLIDHFWEIHTKNIGSKPVVDIDTSDLKNPELVRYMMEKEARKLKLVDPDKKGINSLKDDIDDPEEFAVGGRVGFNEGTLDPAKEKQIKQMIKMGADTDTISTITGATPQQIQQIQNIQQNKRVGYAYGSGLKLIELLKKANKSLKQAIKESADDIIPTGDSKLDADMAVDNLLEKLGVDRDAVDGYDILDAYDEAYKTVTRPKVLQGGIGSLSDEEGMEMMNTLYPEGKIRIGGQELDLSDIANDIKLMNEKGLRGDRAGDFDKFVEMQLSGELGPQQQMKTIKMELRNKYSRYLDDETMDVIQTSNDPQKVAEAYANVREAALLSDRGVPTEEIVDTIIKAPRTKQADGTGPQGLNYLLGF